MWRLKWKILTWTPEAYSEAAYFSNTWTKKVHPRGMGDVAPLERGLFMILCQTPVGMAEGCMISRQFVGQPKGY